MKRCVLLITLLAALASPARAWADVTGFAGFSPTPSTRPTSGFAFGINLLIVGFEFEYGHTSESPDNAAPGLTTGMVNGILETPTHTQFYLTAGGGFYHETLLDAASTSVGTNIGGGVKMGLVGPLRLRLDYRVFSLRGSPIVRNPQRFYAGLNLSF